MSCYKHILEVLRCLLDTSCSHPMAPSLPRAPGPPPPPDPNELPPGQAGEFAETVMRVGLASEDQLFHAALYQWLTDQGQFERLLSIRSPFLEDFLTKGTKKHPESIVMFDLLWKFYEKTKSYPAAARILSKLADRHSTEINLAQRLEYLSRAIMCVKSGEVGSSSGRGGGAGSVGELLHDLEEKMEVARVQVVIVEALQQLEGGEAREALSRLNAELLDISQLYQDFAEPFRLWECQLSILHCAGHHDPPLVESMWEHILQGQLDRSAALPVPSRVALLTGKIKELAKIYANSQKYFPLGMYLNGRL